MHSNNYFNQIVCKSTNSNPNIKNSIPMGRTSCQLIASFYLRHSKLSKKIVQNIAMNSMAYSILYGPI